MTSSLATLLGRGPRSTRTRSHATPPGPRPRYPGYFLKAIVNGKLELFSEMASYGDVSQISIGPQRVVLLMHPDDIKRVLVTQQRSFTKGRSLERTEVLLGKGLLTSEGEYHLRQRRLVQPAFHRERLVSYASTMVEYANRMQMGWRDGELRDAHGDMMRLALAIAGRTLFDVDVERDAHDVEEVLDLSLKLFNYSILPLGALIEYVPLAWVRDLRGARKRMEALIYRLIAERRADGADRGDLLSMLVAARDAEGDGTGMTDQQLRDEIVTLLLAGHETTANALTWSWYLLSEHPEVEAELHAELDRVLGGRLPTVDDLPHLTYTRAVLAESMRLRPPAWTLERSAQEDFEAGGYVIKRGAIVLMSQYLVHRDPRWWSEPERFDPGRWTAEPQAERQPERPKFSYFPFGAGTRMCVGEHFAWMEGTLVLATLAQRWKLRYESAETPVLEPLVTLRPRDGLPVRVRER
jgi:cytochrome P450